jgi:hypothetical protein
MKNEVLSILEFILLDIMLDFGLDALLASHSSQGRTPNFVSLLPLVTAEDELCNHSKLLFFFASLCLVADEIHLGF